MKNFVINTILLLVSLTLMLVSAEFIVRWAYADITSTANMQTWFGARWKKEYVQLNSLGYREKEVSSSKDGSSFRIIVIGDSFGYGQGLPVTDRFSSLIESRLNQRSVTE